MKKTEWAFREGLHEENVPKLMWEALELIRSGKDEEALKLINQSIEATPKLIAKYIKDSRLMPLIDASKSSICFYAMKLYKVGGCDKCIADLLRELSFTPECQIALRRFISSIDGGKELIMQMLYSYPVEVLTTLQELPRKDIEPFFEVIYKIAKNEIGEKQYLALMLMENFLDKEEVVKLFKVFSQDWDPRVRRISIEALSKLKSEDKEGMKEFFKKLLKEEDDAVNISLIKKYLEES